ncbi:GspH/FimT family protein [Methyloglobulus sp.]|uniref:GspH/FimT family pseudopilin n=1 Tax=Methyloglobulus sp. TaxID=2518622 RepID=UPI0032B73EC0
MPNKPITSLGLTLPEVVTTVCISGILATVAIPNFMNAISNNRSTSISNQVVATLAYSRSEAIKRGQQVTIKHKGTTLKVWDNGWDIFADSNGDGTMNNTDELLKTYEALPEGYTLRTGGNYASWVAFLAMGNSRGATGLANDRFSLCDSSRKKAQSRVIIISKVGRVRTETGKAECQ